MENQGAKWSLGDGAAHQNTPGDHCGFSSLLCQRLPLFSEFISVEKIQCPTSQTHWAFRSFKALPKHLAVDVSIFTVVFFWIYAYARRKQTLSVFHTHSHYIFFRVLLKEKNSQASSAPNVQPHNHLFSSGYPDWVIFPHVPDVVNDLPEQVR